MKTKRLSALREETENANKKLFELTDDELREVTGGAADTGGNPFSLTGPYYDDSYGSSDVRTKAIGWSGLTIGRIFSDRAAPLEIKHNGTTIGWAPRSSVSLS